MEERMITKEPTPKKRRPAMPIAREWVEILDRKNDKSPTLLEFKEIVGTTKYMAEGATAIFFFFFFFCATAVCLLRLTSILYCR